MSSTDVPYRRPSRLRWGFLIYGIFFAPASVVFVASNFESGYPFFFCLWSAAIYFLANLGNLFYSIRFNFKPKKIWKAVAFLWVLHFAAEGILDNASTSSMGFYARVVTWILGFLFFLPSFIANFKTAFFRAPLFIRKPKRSPAGGGWRAKFRLRKGHLPVMVVLLLAVICPAIHGMKVRSQAREIIADLEDYRRKHGQYPESLQDLMRRGHDEDLSYQVSRGTQFALYQRYAPYPVYATYFSYDKKWRGGFAEFFETKLLNYLARVWESDFRGRKSHESLSLAKGMLPYIAWRFGQEDWRTVEAHHRIALSYQKQGSLKEALDHYRHAEEIMVKAGGPPTGESMANFSNHYGHLLLYMGLYDEAETKLSRVLNGAEGEYPEIKGSAFETEAILHLGTVYLLKGENQKARQMYQRAMELFEKGPEPQKNLSLGVCYQGLANVFRAEKKAAEAENYYERAVVLLARALPASRTAMGILKRDMAQLFLEQRNYEKALPLAEESAYILSDQQESGFWEIGSSVNLLGAAYHGAGNTEKAAEVYESLIKELNEAGAPDAALIQPMVNLGEVYVERKDFSKARNLYQDLKDLLEPYKEDEPALYLAAAVTLARVVRELNDIPQAVRLAGEVLGFAEGKPLAAEAQKWAAQAREIAALPPSAEKG